MPITQRILISYEEYQRLNQSEKQYKLFLQKKDGQKEEKPADELAGAGSLGQETVTSFSSQLTDSGPVLLNTNVLPPQPSPLVYNSVFPDRTDRIRQEAKRDKTLPPSLPLNDPLGVPDPNLPDGEAPVRPFVATQKQRDQDNSVSLGRPPTEAEAKAQIPWYFIGEDDLDSSDQEDDLMDL